MADAFNTLQQSVGIAAIGLDRAREGVSAARAELLDSNAALVRTAHVQQRLAAELLQAKEAAVHEASHDPLTGLPNRASFICRLEALLAENAERGSYAVLFIDLDRFKIVNDSLGHLAGNRLIQDVGIRLSAVLRGAGPPNGRVSGDMLARLGGDEFTLLLTNLDGENDAVAVADRIQSALAAPFRIEGETVHTSASIGIVMACAHYVAPDELLRDADLAMYRAKHLGKARAELYDPSMHASATTRLHIENDLREAFLDNQFVLHYQPIVSLRTLEMIGLEALVRWEAPGRGLVQPGDFISIAEETGLIVPLGMWVLQQACLRAREWNRFTGRSPISMSVNLSPRQFAQRDLVDEVKTILVRTEVDPALIKLEITEGVTMGDPERAVRVLLQLKALGVQLSVDDFGTGYSSLSYLHRFPLDILKIDRSFVTALPASADSRRIIVTIMALAEGMGMQVVAEGVETPEQVTELQRLGCGLAQGYLFSRPLSQAATDGLLRTSLGQRIGVSQLRAPGSGWPGWVEGGRQADAAPELRGEGLLRAAS